MKLMMDEIVERLPKYRDVFKRLIGVLPGDGRKPITEKKYGDLYNENPSFTDYLPWKDYDDEEGVYLLDDGVSVGVFVEIDPIDIEGRSKDILEKIEEGIQQALQYLPILQDNPWIVQTYLQDEPIRDLIRKIHEYSTEEARQSEHHEIWLRELEEHIEMLAKDGGFFKDDIAQFMWNGQNRKVRMAIYRISDETEWMKKGKPIPGIGTPADEINMLLDSFLSALRQVGIQSRRYKPVDVYNWLFPWFSPKPEGVKHAYDFIKKYPYSEETNECLGASADLAEMVTVGAPESKEDGSWCFTGMPHRLISLQAVNTPPETGVLTAEQESKSGDNKSASMWDKLPKGSIFVTTIVVKPQSQIKAHLNNIIKKSGQGSPEARQAAAQAQDALNNIADRKFLYPTYSGLYIRGHDELELSRNTTTAISILRSFGFDPVEPRFDPTARDNYIRHLPMAYSYNHDKDKSRSARLTYTHHISRMLPFYGRGKGTGNPGFLAFNRVGEPLMFDQNKDKSRVAHSLIFGPTGCGKSATILYKAMHEMALKKPRQIFIEKGDSFYPLSLYYKSVGLTVNHVKFKKSSDISLPPYVNAFKALVEAEADEATMSVMLNTTAEDAMDDEGSDEERDYLGEMEWLTRMMITGAESKEEERFERPDALLIRRAILEATRRQRDANIDHVLPEHVAQVIRDFSNDSKVGTEARKQRIVYMADSLEYWTQGLHGRFFNRPGKSWPEADVTILDMGILTGDNYKDMLAVTIISLLNTITGIGEKYQHSGRETDVYVDEGHIITCNPVLAKPFVFGAKTWRKLSIWLHQATQNLKDYPDEAEKMLSLAEWWYLLNIDESELASVLRFKELSAEHKKLVVSTRKESKKYTEGVVLSDNLKYLFRVVMPALPLSLAGTDGPEKKNIVSLQSEYDCDLLGAYWLNAQKIKDYRAA